MAAMGLEPNGSTIGLRYWSFYRIDMAPLSTFAHTNSKNSNKFEIFYSVNPSPEGAGETRLSTGNRISRPGTKTLAECALDGGGLAWEMVCGECELSRGHGSCCSCGRDGD